MQPTHNAQPQFQLQELEQIESAMQASLRWLETLHGRREALTVELERFTRPQNSASKSSTTMIGPGVEYRGAMSAHWNFIDIHIALLRRLWNDFSDRREAMAKAMRSCGITRVYVAKSPADLFPDQSTTWVQRHSRPLVHGWYADTNLNRERMGRILPAAVDAAGLKWGNDVKVYWQSTPIPA